MWNRMVSRFFAPWGDSVWSQDWAPPVDIEETSDAWIFEVDLPGARRDDLQADVRDGELTCSAGGSCWAEPGAEGHGNHGAAA
jgi:HSP20 family protein